MPPREPTSPARKAGTSSCMPLAKAQTRPPIPLSGSVIKRGHPAGDAGKEAGKATNTAAKKTADGTKEVFEVSGHATVDTGKTVGRYTAIGAKKGEHVTVYYTEEAGKKIAHLFKHL